jgi:UDP-GlcNAc:undecaprenyl-phosphate GlcNAc-1-phosphate transferase
VYSLLVLGITSVLVALVITPVIRDAAFALGWVDRPDGFRKSHSRPIPRVGGVAIVLAYVIAVAVLALLPLTANSRFREGIAAGLHLFPAVAIMFLTGLVDDIRGLSPFQKLTLQIVAAFLATAGGLRITHLGGHEMPVILSIGITVVWLVGCANAFNLTGWTAWRRARVSSPLPRCWLPHSCKGTSIWSTRRRRW